ncbi:MAG: glycoside hydrolase family 2 TIM barrel-domain containing protein [Sphaerochaeta sp.]|jgi:beta-galactosidase
MHIPFNDGWQISESKTGPFEPVTLPHDWLIADLSLASQPSTRWYRRNIDTKLIIEYERLYIHFDGVYQHSTLYLNDKPVGSHHYGYIAFSYEITDLLDRSGENTLLMEVAYHYPSGRWYTGAGIFRDVSLIGKGRCHFAPHGIYVSTEYTDGGWRYHVQTEVIADRPYQTRHTLLDRGEPIQAWDVDNPVLYQLKSELICDGALVDTQLTSIGFRTTAFSADEGFFLNGRPLKLNGVCLHHDLGSLGSALHPDALERQLRLMKEMGANAVRTAHNPPAAHFMEICDRLGLLVQSEFTDVWTQPKNTYDYASHFEECMEEDVKRWIKRDRNHPSLIMWSIGNEIAETHTNAPMARAIIDRFISLIKTFDPNENGKITLCSNYLPWESTQQCMQAVELVGYNYGTVLYEEHHRTYPNWIIYGSETCATVQSRGVYHFPFSSSILSDDDLQCSALGNGITSWGSKSIEESLAIEEKTPYSLGQFIWAGIDYLGEPTPYHTKNSYLGHVDTAGFPKDSYYLFKAAWSEEAVLHLFPYWDFNEGQLIDVRVYSNAHSVELFLNEASCGRITLAPSFSATWSVAYQEGTIKAIAYDENGLPIGEAKRSSFGEAVTLTVEQKRLGDLTFATVEAVDEMGRSVENARCRANIIVSGGTLLSLDNGDSTDTESYRQSSRRLFGGKLLAIASGKNPKINASIDRLDIPCRAIRLTWDGMTIKALPLPANATDTALHWRITDSMGVDSPVASLDIASDGMSAVIRPLGDGLVFVRCGVKNGRDHLAFYSQLEVPIEGMGKTLRSPYHYVWGTWYDRAVQQLTNGNERGVATLRDGMSIVSFADLDFGSWGSKKLTLHLFPLTPDPFDFDLTVNGEVAQQLRWEKGTIWNTYQEATYTLKDRINGIVRIGFVFDRKVHLKGFQFTAQSKSYARLPMASCDTIVADDYYIAGDEIHRITNNASIRFSAMTFDQGLEAVAIRWRSEAEITVLHLIIEQGPREVRHLIHLKRAPLWQEGIFDAKTMVDGECTVRLEFLPGTVVDLAWMQCLPRGGTIDASDQT